MSWSFRFHPQGRALILMVTLSLGACLGALLAAGEDEQSDPDRETVRVAAERFNFTPSKIRVKRGTPLEIILTSEDTFHGFRIPKASLDVTIPARGRGSVTVLFRADQPGQYSFECSRPCGAGHTLMRGVIEVE